MPRKPASTAVTAVEPVLDDTRVTGAALAMVADHEEAQRLATAFGYTGEISVPALEAQIRRDVRTTAEAALATGAGLLMLRQLTPHGEFIERVESLGVNQRVARRLMTLAVKFAKSDSKSVLIAAAGSQTKLLELAILDDAELDVLSHGGTVKGITLDEIDTMSASQLRDALREKEDLLQVANTARDKLRDRNDKLSAAFKRFKSLEPDEELAGIQKDAIALMNDLRGGLAGGMRQAIVALQNHGEDRQAHSRFAAGLLAEVQHELNTLREEFGLPDGAAEGVPEWLRDDDAADGKTDSKSDLPPNATKTDSKSVLTPRGGK